MNEWIEIDMGSVQKVRRTHLQFEYPEHVYQYVLKYSINKTDWKVFADKRSNQKPGCPMVDDNDVDARYFRVTITNMEPIRTSDGVRVSGTSRPSAASTRTTRP